jgi:hypothetical protein
MKPLRLCYLAFAWIIVTSCTHKKEITPAYYFWRTEGRISSQERERLRKHQVHTLYTKVLDIDWSAVNGAIPVASLDINDFNKELNKYDTLGIKILPVVFITNKTFSNIDSTEIPILAKRVLRRCLPAYDSTDIAYENRNDVDSAFSASPNEIQFDCDWTVSTAKKYFQFLKTVRQLLPSDSIHISATIRLHQYKYPGKTGVPPVDRGMLMLYNVSDLTRYSPVNSIFDKEKAAAYFTGNTVYPLPLDIALPAYSWALIFRNRKFYQIKNDLYIDSSFASAGDMKNFYRVKKDTVLGDLFLRPGDEIKIESIDGDLLAAAVDLSKRAVNNNAFRVALFELSSNEIKQISDETLSHTYSSYR